MLSYIIRRLLLIVPTLLGITVITFGVMALSPGGIKGVIANQEGMVDPRQRAAIRRFLEKKYGLDKPLPVQYCIWLNKISPIGCKKTGQGWPGKWTVGLKIPDLGDSINARRPVLEMIKESLPITLLLNVITLPLILGISVWSGIVSANKRGGFVDVAGGGLLLGLWSVPQIWAGVLLVGVFGNREMVHWFPAAGLHDLRADEMNFLPTLVGGFHRGWLLDTAWHLVLPITCLTYASFAFMSKLTRGSMLESVTADFVRTARAKGASPNTVLYRHVLRNALLPLITSLASILPGLIGGSIIVESIFAIPGMGKLGVDAVFDKDPEMVLSIAVVASLLGLVSFLLADVAYAVADPRVSFEGSGS